MGPPGPTRAAGWRPVRVAMCSGSSCWRDAPRPALLAQLRRRRAMVDYSRGLDARPPAVQMPARPAHAYPAEGSAAQSMSVGTRSLAPSSKTACRRVSTRVAARSSSTSTSERLLPAALPLLTLRLDLASPASVRRETTTRLSRSRRARSTCPLAARWSSICVTVAGVSCAASASSPRRALRAPPARTAARTVRGSAPAPRWVSRPRRRLRLRKVRRNALPSSMTLLPPPTPPEKPSQRPPWGSRPIHRLRDSLGVGCGALRVGAGGAPRGRSARSSIVQGISVSAAIPSAHQ